MVTCLTCSARQNGRLYVIKVSNNAVATFHVADMNQFIMNTWSPFKIFMYTLTSWLALSLDFSLRRA